SASSPARSSTHRLLHERGDPLLVGLRQLRQRIARRPHRAVVEARVVVEAEGRVALLEFAGVFEEADDLVVLRIRGHAVPRPRRAFSVVTCSASSGTRMCFFIPVREMANGCASSLTEAGPRPSRSSTARRVGSARAVKVRSTGLY